MGGEDASAPLMGNEEKAPTSLDPTYNAPQYNAPPPQAYPPAQSYPPQYSSPPPQQYGAQPYPPQYQAGYPYPQAGYQQPPAPVGVAPMGAPYGAPQVMAQDIRFREIPVVCTCTFCGNNGPTRVEFVNGTLTWLAAGGICLIGCWLGCCLIPFAVDGCKDVEHHCGSCQRVIGVYRRIN
eukprot:Phypoly_transcript_21775.p1 GENE.Phypoly_transcript_21775~~Phypoly_transcript_21775.p1  ORF type:complete len:180 (+),score=31.63 Phypoly_transcript_21775:30-569(+)